MSNLSYFFTFLVLSLLSCFGLYKLLKKWQATLTTTLGKFIKFLIAALLLLSMLICIFATYINFQDYWNKERLRVFNEANGVKLGISDDDLIFSKGKPKKTLVVGNETFLQFEDGLVVVTENSKVIRVEISCGALKYSYGLTFGGVSCYSSLDTLIDRFGEPNSISSKTDKTSRIYNYPKFNIAFELSKSSITDILIFDSTISKGGLEFNEQPAKPQKKESPTGKPPQSSGKLDYQNTDHCAPNLSREERLRRLALTGTVRETSYQTYSNGNHFVSFLSSGPEVAHCR